MKRETDGMVGTEWQVVELYPDFEPGTGSRVKEKLKWIREYEGLGRYYSDYIFNTLIYFERDEDREMFLLRWS